MKAYSGFPDPGTQRPAFDNERARNNSLTENFGTYVSSRLLGTQVPLSLVEMLIAN
jgi:hypothetical protein